MYQFPDAGQRPAQVFHPHAGDLPAPLVPEIIAELRMQAVQFQRVYRLGPVDRPQRLHDLLNGGGNGLLGGSASMKTDADGGRSDMLRSRAFCSSSVG